MTVGIVSETRFPNCFFRMCREGKSLVICCSSFLFDIAPLCPSLVLGTSAVATRNTIGTISCTRAVVTVILHNGHLFAFWEDR